MIAGLLEGAAFLAARVQLKLKHEFSDFTTNLIDQLAPHYLAPTPSFVLAQAQPNFGDPASARGADVARGAYFDADLSRSSSATSPAASRSPTPITLWPFEIAKAEYLTSAGAVAGAGPRRRRRLRGRPAAAAHACGRRRGSRTSRADKEAHDAARAAVLVVPRQGAALPSARPGSRRGRAVRAAVRALPRASISACSTRSAIPSSSPGGADMMRQIGFDEDEALIPNDKRLFRGFDFLRDYFAFPRRFLGFDLDRPRRDRAAARSQDRRYRARLRRRQSAPRRGGAQGDSSRSTPRRASTCSKRRSTAFRSSPTSTNFPVIPDRSRLLDFETEPGHAACSPIFPASPQKVAGRAALFGDGRAQRDRALLHDPPPAAPAHDRGEANTGQVPTTPAPTCSCRSASGPIPKSFNASPN